jgi:hypothetical protein
MPIAAASITVKTVAIIVVLEGKNKAIVRRATANPIMALIPHIFALTGFSILWTSIPVIPFRLKVLIRIGVVKYVIRNAINDPRAVKRIRFPSKYISVPPP